MRATAKVWSVRATFSALVSLTVACGALVLARSDLPASASSRPLKAATAASAHDTVDLFGDSLGFQAQPYIDMFLAAAGNYTVSSDTFGGTATCDWLSRMAAAAVQHPQAAVLVFSGNAFTPCMDRVVPGSPEYYRLYSTATERAIGIFSAVGAHVFLVGTPIDRYSKAGWNRLDDIYRQLARGNPVAVTYVDAAAAVESASGGFTWRLPCMSSEPICGANGTNVVRAPDGGHFCPDGAPATRGVTRPCDVYSSGAFRFALAIVSAITRYSHLASAPVLTAR